MAAFTAWLLKRGTTMKTLKDAGILLFLLTMMATMFISTVAYLYFPGYSTLVLLLIFNMVSMSVFLIPVLATLALGDRPLEDVRKGKTVGARALFVGSSIALVILSELFMGWTFAILGGAVSTAGGAAGALSALISSASSYWFVFTMAAEMAITLVLVRKSFPRDIGWIVAAQTAIMVLSPTAISGAGWANFALLSGSGVMIVLFIYMFEFIYKNRELNSAKLSYLVSLMLAYALMMGGVFLWFMGGSPSLFVLSVVVEMSVYFSVLLNEGKLGSPELKSWQSLPYWVFGLLGLLFVAEFFMGGAFDIYFYGTSYFTSLPFAALSGSALGMLSAAAYNFLTFFISITASPWYLIMMGVEMGALVVFKMKAARELETKVRLGMVIAAYGVYSIFLPSFVLSAILPQVPWIGWSMGLGTAGALAPAVIVALVATYVISGGLSFLFGSRNVCSLFCTAALMYQGTTIDAMSSFNRTSSIGRKFLTTRISSVYKFVVSVVWVSLLVAAVLSYLSSVGAISVSIFGTDASYFLYAFYFDFLWYIIWIMIPFLGTYGCATTGMCGWGSFNQLVSRLGFFKLKVMDSDTCVKCETKDCAKTCPVGITDQPGAFIASGELKSFKCIGVGDCVSACPYSNIYFYDVRGWIRQKLGRPARVGLPAMQPVSLSLKGKTATSE